MSEQLYNLMNWPEIEAIVYSEHDNPHQVLGARETEYGILITTFDPYATGVEVLLKGKKTPVVMEKMDDGGYYACLVSGKKIPEYQYRYIYEDSDKVCYDPYRFLPQISEEELKAFGAGIHYSIYEKLGAHPMTINGIEGVYFAVWAPYAIRVSIVGDFNMWDGRRHPMRRLGYSGVHELFLPGVKVGDIYKYEIKAKGGLT